MILKMEDEAMSVCVDDTCIPEEIQCNIDCDKALAEALRAKAAMYNAAASILNVWASIAIAVAPIVVASITESADLLKEKLK